MLLNISRTNKYQHVLKLNLQIIPTRRKINTKTKIIIPIIIFLFFHHILLFTFFDVSRRS